MKLRALLYFSLALAAAWGQEGSEYPHLRRQGTATQLIVDGKPFLALAGELGNNSATSIEYLKPFWPKLIQSGLNTVLAAVSWAQIEPAEGKFDFSVLDGVIRDARSNNMHLVLLWFASWKNGLSTYAPDWVKRDFERFPRARNAGGTSIELLSPFSDASRDQALVGENDSPLTTQLRHFISTSDLSPGEYIILGLLTQLNNGSNVMFGYFIGSSLLLI